MGLRIDPTVPSVRDSPNIERQNNLDVIIISKLIETLGVERFHIYKRFTYS